MSAGGEKLPSEVLNLPSIAGLGELESRKDERALMNEVVGGVSGALDEIRVKHLQAQSAGLDALVDVQRGFATLTAYMHQLEEEARPFLEESEAKEEGPGRKQTPRGQLRAKQRILKQLCETRQLVSKTGKEVFGIDPSLLSAKTVVGPRITQNNVTVQSAPKVRDSWNAD